MLQRIKKVVTFFADAKRHANFFTAEHDVRFIKLYILPIGRIIIIENYGSFNFNIKL